MGNCMRKNSSEEWGGEEWGSFGSGDKTRNCGGTRGGGSPESSLIRESEGVLSYSLAAAATEVKIKISKKELEKLLKEANIEGLSAQQVLAQLVTGDQLEAHPESWRPALQSIPE